MLRLKSTIAVGVILAFTASAALADGMPRAAMKTAPVQPSWTGCYLGVGGGYGMYDLDTHLNSAATGLPITVSLDQGGRGWFGTAQVGCDYQFSGRWLVGAFIDGDLSGITGKHTGQSIGVVGLVSADMQLSSSWAVGG